MRNILLSIIILIGSCAYAMGGAGGGQRGEQGGPGSGNPPQEAITACESKQVDEQCTMQSPRGDSMQGTCKMDGDYLACRPEGMGRDRENSDNSNTQRYIPSQRSYID